MFFLSFTVLHVPFLSKLRIDLIVAPGQKVVTSFWLEFELKWHHKLVALEQSRLRSTERLGIDSKIVDCSIYSALNVANIINANLASLLV